jgi:hypothetical protein
VRWRSMKESVTEATASGRVPSIVVILELG